MQSPATIEELLCRAEALAGRSLGELAHAHDVRSLGSRATRNTKGKPGELIEIVPRRVLYWSDGRAQSTPVETVIDAEAA